MSADEFPLDDFYAARHGFTKPNETGTLSDLYSDLVEKGRQQAMTILRPALQAVFPDRKNYWMVTSIMMRAIRTGDLGSSGTPPDWATKDLNEIYHGRAAGKANRKKLEAVIRNRAERGLLPIDYGAESPERFKGRVVKGFHNAAQKCPKDRKLFLVTHEHVMEVFSEELGFKMHGIKNVALYHFKRDKGTRAWSVMEVQPDGQEIPVSKSIAPHPNVQSIPTDSIQPRWDR